MIPQAEAKPPRGDPFKVATEHTRVSSQSQKDNRGISVVIATYNGERFIEEQLESILQQDTRADEIVAVDDGSTDDTVHILRAYAARHPTIRLLEGNVNVGLSRNLDKGLRAAKNSILVLADQDDVWRKDKLSYVSEAFSDPTVRVWASDAAAVGEFGEPLGYTAWQAVTLDEVTRRAIEGGSGLARLLYRGTITGATMAVHREVLKLACPLPSSWPRFSPYLHDGWLALFGAVLGSIKLSSEQLVNYRQHAAQQVGLPRPRAKVDCQHRPISSYFKRDLESIRRQAQWTALVAERLHNHRAELSTTSLAFREILNREHWLAARLQPRPFRRIRAVTAAAFSGAYSDFSPYRRTLFKDLLLR